MVVDDNGMIHNQKGEYAGGVATRLHGAIDLEPEPSHWHAADPPEQSLYDTTRLIEAANSPNPRERLHALRTRRLDSLHISRMARTDRDTQVRAEARRQYDRWRTDRTRYDDDTLAIIRNGDAGEDETRRAMDSPYAPAVAAAVMSRWATGADAEACSRHADPNVRYASMESGRLPDHVWHRLAFDPDTRVACRALDSGHVDPYDTCMIARNPRMDDAVRIKAVARGRCDLETLNHVQDSADCPPALYDMCAQAMREHRYAEGRFPIVAANGGPNPWYDTHPWPDEEK